MGFSLGIVGLPNVGKSTLFNCLSKARAECANYPFCTIDPNVGVVEVPDKRLKVYTDIFSSKKTVPTVIEFYDIAGLVKGASQGEGLGNQFLSHIREVDAIAHVVRCFPDPNIVHVSGTIDPKRDIEIINLELILADLQVIEKRHAFKKSSAKTGDKKLLEEVDFLSRLKAHLEAGNPARRLPFAEKEKEMLKEVQLLTVKPQLYVANVDESGNRETVKQVEAIAAEEGVPVVAISAKLEAEVQELSEEEAREYMREIGLEKSGLADMIRGGYGLLDLITFFTAGEKETRAWTIKRGTLAPQAAGCIHSDFERGFIAAEVIHYADLEATRSYQAAKEKGMVRTEGKNYLVQDGDWMLFRFNV
ncbi:redox-regulated ATPase YchF [Candidatus Saganbacteria bacterium]|nr:redox-regulated ATPase YchF [Candidatus Saganbacteria bacterium]